MGEQETIGARRTAVVVSATLGTFIGQLGLSMVNLALAGIESDFQVPLSSVQWVATVYAISLTSMLPVMGRLADSLGQRRVYLTGWFLVCLSSLAAGLAPSMPWLLVGRALQGASGAMLFSNTMAIVASVFPPEQRGRPISLVSLAAGLGALAGPSLGGLILTVASWRWLFYFLAIVSLLGGINATRAIPALNPPSRAPFDALGAMLLVSCTAGLAFVLTQSPALGFFSVPVLVGLLTAILSGVGLGYRLSTTTEPVLDLKLLRHPTFCRADLANLLCYLSVTSVTLVYPYDLLVRRHWDPGQVGLLMSLYSFGLVLLSAWTGRASDRWGRSPFIVAGGAVMLINFGILAGIGGSAGFLAAGLNIFVLGLGMGVFTPANNSLMMDQVEAGRLGRGSSLIAFARNLGILLGNALATAAYQLGNMIFGTTTAYSETTWATPWLLPGLLSILAMGFACLLSRRKDPSLTVHAGSV